MKFTLLLTECLVFTEERNMLFNDISKVCTMFLQSIKSLETCMAF